MKKWRKMALLLGLLAMVFFGCAEKATEPKEDKDTTEPSLNVDTVDDTVTIDALSLTGSASDESGIEQVSATVNGATTVIDNILDNNDWSIDVALNPGGNTIVVTAEDENGNKRSSTVEVYYQTDYFPVTDSSYWKFQGVQDFDSIVVAVDSSAPILGSIHLYRLNFTNYLRSETDTLFLLYDNGKYKMHDEVDSLLDTENVLFLEEYTTSPQSYNNKTIVFVGDTTMNSVTYRNVVRVQLIQSERIARISAFYLAPSLGLVAVYANDELYPIE